MNVTSYSLLDPIKIFIKKLKNYNYDMGDLAGA